MKKPASAAVLAALLVAAQAVWPGPAAVAGATPGAGGDAAAREDGPGAVVINELLPAPGNRSSEEWVELFNGGSAAADLGGWALDDAAGGGSKPFGIPNGTVLLPGGFLVLYNSTTHVALNNDGDTVRLLDPSGTVIDSCSYVSSAYDLSFGRFPDGGPDWRRFDAPTPGASNGAWVPPGPADGSVLITQVYYHAFGGRGDEFVAVANPDAAFPVDLSGWSVSSGGGAAVFPDGTSLLPGATVFVTGNASDFLADVGSLPDFETRNTRPEVKQARSTGGWPALGNDGGNVSLRNANGEAIDAVAWGRPFNGTGWSGPPAAPLSAGEVARRLRDGSGRWLDTNSSPDWPASAAAVVGRSEFSGGAFDAESVSAFVSPDSAFGAVAGELDTARVSILVSVYQFESWPLARKLVAARERNVAVNVIMEGAPVEGISDQERAVAESLFESGASVSYITSRPGSGIPDRYSYLHAKYCIVDNLTCIVSSENWKTSGIPSDTSYGNRGWGVAVRSRELAAYLSAVFGADSNPAMRDVIPFSPEGGTFGPPPAGFVPDTAVPKGSYQPRFSTAVFGPGIRIRPVLAPDTSSLENGPVLGLIRSAERTLCIEQLSCPPDWDDADARRPNAYLEAVVEAARRGVRVRLLLDGTYLDPDDSLQNADALNYLNYVAAAEGLDLQARIAKVPGTLKLHNKGVVADGERALVSSLNWGRNSVFENREVGLVLEGAGVARYFESAFFSDWNFSAPGAKPGGNGTGGEDGGSQVSLARALVLSVTLVAVAVMVVLWRAGGRRRHY